MKKTNEADTIRKELEARKAETAHNVQTLTEASRMLAEIRAKAYKSLSDLDREDFGQRVQAFNQAADVLADVLAGALSYAYLLEAQAKDVDPEAEAAAAEAEK